MRHRVFSIILALFALCLTACGGGGGGSTGGSNGPGLPGPGVRHEVTLNLTAHTMVVKLAVENGQVTHLVRNNAVATLPLTAVKTVVWNSQCKGWLNAGGVGIQTSFASNSTTLSGLVPSDRGLVSLITHEGVEYYLNANQLAANNALVKDGNIWYGDVTSSAISCPGVIKPPEPVFLHEASIESGAMTVKLAVNDGMVLHLVQSGAVATVPVSTIQKVVWNSQCKGWLNAGGSGIQVPFANNTTVLSGLVPSDRGGLSVITNDGKEYFLNLEHLKTGNGVVKNGELWYGDVTSAAINCPSVTPPPPPPPVIVAPHEVTVAASTMTVKLAIDDSRIAHLVRNGTVTTLPLTAVKTVVWNSQCKGWISAGGTGVQVLFANNLTTLSGLVPSDRGTISVVTHDGSEYFLNLDHVKLTNAVIKNNEIRYGDTDASSISCVVTPVDPFHEVSITGSSLTVKLAVSGTQVMNLVRNSAVVNVPLTAVKTVVWNSQCKGWYVAGGGGLKTSFVNNQTPVTGLAPSDRGSFSIITHDGTEYFVNIDKVEVTGGVVKNGGIWYGDVTSNEIKCP